MIKKKTTGLPLDFFSSCGKKDGFYITQDIRGEEGNKQTSS